MDFRSKRHLIIKHTIMTNNEILQANLLDIIFENRNKDYGAYALRKGYNTRLLAALGAGLFLLLSVIFFNKINGTKKSETAVVDKGKGIVIRQIEMPKDIIKEPEKPKVLKTQQPAPKIAAVKFTTPKIKEDDKVKETLAAVNTMNDKIISTENIEGKPDDGTVKVNPQPVENNGTGDGGPSQPKEPDFIVQERDPEFPGGPEALRRFLGKNLATPDELVAGEKKVVRIRFKVDKDGSVNTFEIETSGGNQFDNEVVRVCKRMPKWTPAIQNGINVPVNYVLPVTFIGVEQ